MDRVLYPARVGDFWQVDQHVPSSAATTPLAITTSGVQVMQIFHQQNIGKPPWAIEPISRPSAKVFSRIDRRHLDRRHRAQPLLDGVPHRAVHVTVFDQGLRMAVIGAQNEMARIHAQFGHRFYCATTSCQAEP